MVKYFKDGQICYNPYFIGNHSATMDKIINKRTKEMVTILILLEIILQHIKNRDGERQKGYNPYFIGNHSATK